MRRYLVAAAVLMLVSVSAAPGKEPSHPLSQINPIDIDLNMSEQDIFNVSVFSLRDGLRFEGNQIQDSGGNPVLVWNDSSSQWELRNGDLNVQYNNISAPPGKNVSFQQNIRINGGGRIWVPEQTSTPRYYYRKNLSEVLEDGESADRFDINLSGNNLESPDQIITDGSGSDVIEIRDRANTQDIARFREGGDVEVPNGNLNVSGNDLVSATNIKPLNGENLFLETDGSGSASQVVLYDRANTQAILTAKEGGNVEIPNGDLKMSDNNIDNISSLDGDGNAIEVDDDLDMRENDVENVTRVSFSGDGAVDSSSSDMCLGDRC